MSDRYDSRPATMEHIERVRQLLGDVRKDLFDRAFAHDQSKLVEPELSIFDKFTPKLRVATIRDEPGKWSEQRIADAGAFDREQVAEVCGLLLDAGEITLSPDGTYAPVEAGAIAA